jgi:4-hydroxybenzoate polyprenyltransferase
MMRDVWKSFLKELRPRQWAKNVFVFGALVFDGKVLDPGPLARTVAGFILLCLISSAVYIFNDIADLEADRQHPAKRHRPIASGALPVRIALPLGVGLTLLTLLLSLLLEPRFGLIVAGYFGLNLLYSYRLKHSAIIDVLIVAAGFVLRVAAGVSLINVTRFSPWLYVCTTLLSLIIGFGKRRAELLLLAEGANSHRRVLDGYTIPLLDQLIMIASASTIMAYSLYTFSAENLPDNHLMMLTIPFVMYGIFRYLHLVHVEHAGGAPEELILTDRPMLVTLILWGLLALIILYVGQ